MAGLLFLDGASHPHCRRGTVAAFTAPGWRVVYVCPATFQRHLKGRPEEAETVIIHEVLHTLGLGENPPAPRDIEVKVHARCVLGDAAACARDSGLGRVRAPPPRVFAGNKGRGPPYSR